MTATDELRRMLDERGVEWWQSANTLGCIFTRWHSPLFGDEVCAMENGKDGLVLFDHFMTPEQAIAATLGRVTCKLPETRIDHGSIEYNGTTEWRRCSRCNAEVLAYPSHFCPSCGAEVMDE